MATIKSTLRLYDGVTGPLRNMNTAINTVLNSFESMQRKTSKAIDTAAIQSAREELAKVEATFDKIEKEIRQADEEQKKFNRNMQEAPGAADKLMSKLGGIAAGVFTLQKAIDGVKFVMDWSDNITQTTARLNMMNDGLQTTDGLWQKIGGSALRSRSDAAETANAVSKMGLLAGDAFKSNDEIIAFSETMNKAFKIGGSSLQEQAAATRQLIQAMGSGRLQGEEFVSVMENGTLIGQAIADYMDIPIGKLKEMSSEGIITADIIKDAVFAATDDINERFKTIPATWSDVWTGAKTIISEVFRPAAGEVGSVADYIYSKLGYLKVGLLKMKLTWVSVWEILKLSLASAVVFLSGKWEDLKIGFAAVSVAIANYAGDMKVKVLLALQNMANGSLDIINKLISRLNTIPGVSIQALEKVTFGTAAQLENDARKQQNQAVLKYMTDSANEKNAQMYQSLKLMKQNGMDNVNTALARVTAAEMDALYGPKGIDVEPITAGAIGDIAGDTGRIADSMERSEEDLKYLRDLAEREVVNRFATREIFVDMSGMTNQINSEMDLDGVVSYFEEKLTEALESSAEGVYA